VSPLCELCGPLRALRKRNWFCRKKKYVSAKFAKDRKARKARKGRTTNLSFRFGGFLRLSQVILAVDLIFLIVAVAPFNAAIELC